MKISETEAERCLMRSYYDYCDKHPVPKKPKYTTMPLEKQIEQAEKLMSDYQSYPKTKPVSRTTQCTGGIHWVRVLILLLILSYPFNWVMMRQGIGIYRNSPVTKNTESDNDYQRRRDKQSAERTLSFIVSPITAPISAVVAVVDLTIR